MAWEPFGRLVRARLATGQIEVVNAEMWDPDTGSVMALLPTATEAPEIGARRWGPDERRTEIGAGDWWEIDPLHDGDWDDSGEFDYFTEHIEAPARSGAGDDEPTAPPSVVLHRAPKGTGSTLCGRQTRTLQPLTSEWDPVLALLLCGRGCRPQNVG
jgi:hypothetical protein